MKIAIASDLHLDVAPMDCRDLTEDAVDLMIIAGDLTPFEQSRMRWLQSCENHYRVPVFWIPGNHDFWGRTPATHPMRKMELPPVTIAGATLWTHLKPHEWIRYIIQMRDYREIWNTTMNWNEETYNSTHAAHKRFLFQSASDIVVSHHAPSHLSIHDRFKGDQLNCCFANALDEEILELKSPPKLWIHGHVHDSFDYQIGNTRVVCNPRGYPHESNFLGYKAKVITV